MMLATLITVYQGDHYGYYTTSLGWQLLQRVTWCGAASAARPKKADLPRGLQ